MRNVVLQFGISAALTVGVPLFAITCLVRERLCTSTWAMGAIFAFGIAALIPIVLAVREARARRGGSIGFLPAFGIGLGVGLVAALGYVIAWELALAVTEMDFGREYAATMIEQQRRAGLSGEALERYAADMALFRDRYALPQWRLAMTFAEYAPLAVLAALASASILRRRVARSG